VSSDCSALPLHNRDTGDGPPLVILHGLFGSSRNWQTIARAIANRFRVISADLRNHGESPHAAAMTYECMTADVFNLMDRLKLDLPILVGHSMGGKVAMTAALLQPERWRCLVIVDIAPVQYSSGFLNRVDAMLALPVQGLRSRMQADSFLRQAEPDPAVRNFLLHNLVARDGHYAWRINLPAIRNALPDIAGFPDLNGPCLLPTLALRGERSGALRPQHQPRLLELFPRAEIVTLPGAGHWPHAEMPEAFLAALNEFLESIS
jgi:pimeloyl-ACP methyl ester carboxylesterase